MNKNYSMKDIAKLSGVSVATVSRVINNNGRFSEETRKKVEQIIEETGYQLNYSAKSLRMNKSLTIGILVPDITNYFFAEVVQKIEEFLFLENYSSIICNTNRDANKEKSYLNTLEGKGVDGLIVISGPIKFDYDSFSNSDKIIPYVCINSEPKNKDKTITITSDNYQGAFEAAEELIKNGSKNPVITVHERQSYTGDARSAGFVAALEKNNIAYNKNKHFLFIDRNKKDTATYLEKFMVKNPQADGFFAFTDSIAMNLLLTLKKLNYNIPKDIKLIGFDDTPQNKYSSPTLSSVKQDTDQIAKLAVENLLKLIEYPHNTGDTIRVPVSLSLRESTQKV